MNGDHDSLRDDFERLQRRVDALEWQCAKSHSRVDEIDRMVEHNTVCQRHAHSCIDATIAVLRSLHQLTTHKPHRR